MCPSPQTVVKIKRWTTWSRRLWSEADWTRLRTTASRQRDRAQEGPGYYAEVFRRGGGPLGEQHHQWSGVWLPCGAADPPDGRASKNSLSDWLVAGSIPVAGKTITLLSTLCSCGILWSGIPGVASAVVNVPEGGFFFQDFSVSGKGGASSGRLFVFSTAE